MHTPVEFSQSHRQRCYTCFRPMNVCFCDKIPSINNRTHILILQHVKERFHAFNTARIVKHALQNCDLIVDQTTTLAKTEISFAGNSGILFPGDDAQLLSDLPPSQRPDQLVILDGTWHHARTFVRQIPSLAMLPRFRLEPEAPSTYRIRKEPTETALSTIEATVCALKSLEPQTRGLNDLLGAFDAMIETQIQHPRQSGRLRTRGRPWKPEANIPSVLIEDLDNVVVVYGEAAHGANDARHKERSPVFWVAERLGTGDVFECAITPECRLADVFLEHMKLSQADFRDSVSLSEFSGRWKRFVRPQDTVVAFNQNTLKLLNKAEAEVAPSFSLKSVNLQQNTGRLDNVIRLLNLLPERPKLRGRAGERLSNAIALARYLNDLGNQRLRSESGSQARRFRD